VRKHFVTLCRDDGKVLDPNASVARVVRARLDRDDHARLQYILTAGRESGCLVNVEADTVPEGVRERLTESVTGENVARNGVDVLGCFVGADRCE